nr:hypothetical protein [Tanacetum cinerariifolium]
ESDDERDEGSDDDSDETVKAGSEKDKDDDNNEDDDDNDKDNDNDEEEELAKNNEEDTKTGKGGDEVSESESESDEEETRQVEEGSFDPIPRTLEGSEEESNDEEDQELRLSKEARIQEEEEADELYRDVNINLGRSLQVTQNVEDSYVTLTSVNPDGPQESSSVSSFVTSMLNPTSDVGVESIFMTASSPIYCTTVYDPANDEGRPRGNEQRNLYKALVEAYDADKAILDTYGKSTILKRRREDDDQEGPSAGSDRGSKRQKEGGEHASASTPSETATGGAGRSTKGSQSRQLSASESAFAEEPVQTTCQMEEPLHSVFETGADDQPIVQTSQHPECLTEFEYYLEEVYKATTDQLDWVNPEGQQYPYNLLQPLPLIPDNRG